MMVLISYNNIIITTTVVIQLRILKQQKEDQYGVAWTKATVAATIMQILLEDCSFIEIRCRL